MEDSFAYILIVIQIVLLIPALVMLYRMVFSDKDK